MGEISKLEAIDLNSQMEAAKKASMPMSLLSEQDKNQALELIARELLESSNHILEANKLDLEAGKKEGLSSALIDRLTLNEKRLDGMATGLRKIINLKDPVGVIEEGFINSDGLKISKVRVPLGVIGIIYEARPNVTTDAIGLTIKSGNACVLRGSQQAWNTNLAIMDVVERSLKQSKVPEGAVQYLKDKSRESAKALLAAKGLVDLVIPRGGNQLKDFVMSNALIPVLGAGGGICHVYIDALADLEKAIRISHNAKVQRPGVCNACETILIHKDIKDMILMPLTAELANSAVEIVGDQEVQAALPCTPAIEEDWATEYLDLKVSIKVVDNLAEAIEHINRYSTGHSDAIITEDYSAAQAFTRTVDSGAVYVNASTRFTDGEVFGMGAEIGISTQKMHARGPIGLKELCSYKYIIEGSGQSRA